MSQYRFILLQNNRAGNICVYFVWLICFMLLFILLSAPSSLSARCSLLLANNKLQKIFLIGDVIWFLCSPSTLSIFYCTLSYHFYKITFYESLLALWTKLFTELAQFTFIASCYIPFWRKWLRYKFSHRHFFCVFTHSTLCGVCVVRWWIAFFYLILFYYLIPYLLWLFKQYRMKCNFDFILIRLASVET